MLYVIIDDAFSFTGGQFQNNFMSVVYSRKLSQFAQWNNWIQ